VSLIFFFFYMVVQCPSASSAPLAQRGNHDVAVDDDIKTYSGLVGADHVCLQFFCLSTRIAGLCVSLSRLVAAHLRVPIPMSSALNSFVAVALLVVSRTTMLHVSVISWCLDRLPTWTPLDLQLSSDNIAHFAQREQPPAQIQIQ